MFKERLPDVSLPPEPVLTRWGTWLEAACYYADHLDSFRSIIFEFPETASEAIKNVK